MVGVGLFAHASHAAIVESADALRRERSEAIGRAVETYLGQAARAVEHVENQIRYGACRAGDALSVEQHLFAELLNSPDLAEVAFTHAVRSGFDEEGVAVLGPQERWQVSVYRTSADPRSAIATSVASCASTSLEKWAKR